MQFGSKEWLEKLKEIMTFPNTYAFYIGSDKTINSRLIKTKTTDIGNIQYKSLEPAILEDGCRVALITVRKCDTPEDFYEVVRGLRDAWGIS